LGAAQVTYAFDISGVRLAVRLSQDEDALIDFYRIMGAGDKAALLHVARSMAERAEVLGQTKPSSFRPGDKRRPGKA